MMSQSGSDKNHLQLSSLPEELRLPVMHWVDSLEARGAQYANQFKELAGHQATLLRLVASSEYAAGVIGRDWEWFHDGLCSGRFQSPVERRSLKAVVGCIGSDDDDASVRSKLRLLRNRNLVHILWRSLDNLDDVCETLVALSHLADALIMASMQHAERFLFERFGLARNGSNEPVPLVVLAMGKLGGQELNFSSDIDLIFLYTEDGETDGPRSLTAHEYFTRLSRQVVGLLDDVTHDGFVYRVDTRLRPFGESGPPVVSFGALENYLLQHGRSWERYAYVKARILSPGAKAADIRDLKTQRHRTLCLPAIPGLRCFRVFT